LGKIRGKEVCAEDKNIGYFAKTKKIRLAIKIVAQLNENIELSRKTVYCTKDPCPCCVSRFAATGRHYLLVSRLLRSETENSLFVGIVVLTLL